MNLKRILGCLLAVAGGYLAAALLGATGTVGILEPTGQPRMALSKHAERDEVPTPREMLEELPRLPMDPDDRVRMKQALLDTWRDQDPLGFLYALEDHPWPANGYDIGEIYAELARRDPEALIRYARKTGNQDAWCQLAESRDPQQIMGLLLADPAAPRGAMKQVIGTAMAKDPDFYRTVSSLKDTPFWTEAFEGAASALMSRERITEYCAWLHELGESVPAREAGSVFASSPDDYPRRAEQIVDLPETVRIHAAQTMVADLRERASDTEMMKVLATLHQANWWGWSTSDAEWRASLEQAIGSDLLGKSPAIGRDLVLAVETQVSDDPVDTPKPTWAEWALKIPDEGAGKALRNAGIRRWVFDLARTWETEIPKLADAGLRDVAYAQQALFIMDENRLDKNSDRSWEAAVERIESESFRAATRTKIEAERQRLEAGRKSE